MKKTILPLILVPALVFSCHKPEIEKPVVEEPDIVVFDIDEPEDPGHVDELQNLAVLCRVWGLVKYHHPAFSIGGSSDADVDLIALIPKIRNAGNNTRNWMLLKWIRELGKYDSSQEQWNEYVNHQAPFLSFTPKTVVELSWMEDMDVLGDDLSAELCQLRYALRSSRNRYLETTSANVTFLENGYSNISNPLLEYRLLALFRYWNIIEYFFPAKYITDHNWNDVLHIHIPKFIEANGALEYRKAVARLISEINDTHAFSDFIPAFGNYVVDIPMTFIEDKLIATSGFQGSDAIQPGDEILTIGSKTPSETKDRLKEYFSLSNEAGLLRFAAVYARCTNSPEVTVTFASEGSIKTETFPTRQWRSNPTELDLPATRAFNEQYRLVEDGAIGYINAGYFITSNTAEMMNTLKNTKGIIIDMRLYPNELMFYLTYGYFTNIAKDFTKFGQTNATTPGVLYCYNRSTAYSPNYSTYSGKVVIIVNESTQSQGEFTTMQLQTIPGSITIGSQTAGADGNVSSFLLPGNIETTISGLGVYYPDGTETQRVGIRVDLEVKPTIAGIKEGRDELYEKAVALILNQ